MLKDDVTVLKDDIAVLKDDIAVLKDDVARRFDKLTNNAAKRKVDFLRMQGRMHNSLIHNPFLRITLIVVYQPSKEPTLPTRFP